MILSELLNKEAVTKLQAITVEQAPEVIELYCGEPLELVIQRCRKNIEIKVILPETFNGRAWKCLSLQEISDCNARHQEAKCKPDCNNCRLVLQKNEDRRRCLQ
jgi:hypothetical protein